MTPEEFRALAKSPHKYRAKPIEVDGIKFPSTGEANRWLALRTLEMNGVISDLKRQVRYVFEHNGVRIGSYVLDFEYTQDGKRVHEDYKGMRTPLYAWKKRMMLAFYGIAIHETGKGRAM